MVIINNRPKSEILTEYVVHKNALNIAIIMGGLSEEREVSLESGNSVFNALASSKKYNLYTIDMGRDIAVLLEQIKPDLVFNCLHGDCGENGALAGLLDIMGIAYTHSGVLASSLGMNKNISRKYLASHNIKSPKFRRLTKKDKPIIDPMPRPYVIKPTSSGSSLGVEVVFPEDDFNISNYSWKFGEEALVEEYIPGRELNVAILNNKAVGVLELVHKKRRFYDYETKYTEGLADHLLPAPLGKEVNDYVMKLAEKVHRLIGAKSISRIEFIYNEKAKELEDAVYLLEINTHPDCTTSSLAPKVASYYGINYLEFVESIIKNALPESKQHLANAQEIA